VVLGWVLFRADRVGHATTLYAAMFRFDGAGLSQAYAADISGLQAATLALAFAVLAVRGWQKRGQVHFSGDVQENGVIARKMDLTPFLLLPLFALSVLKLSAQSYSPFLYFQF
jgi:alginate O-acetyltransferase complex protein AlgI